MKSELVKSEESAYPALYMQRGVVALFSYDECATIIIGDKSYSIGDYCDSLDVTAWERLPSGSQVILTQD